MNQDRWELVKAVFLSALDRSEAERSTFLDAACAGDPSLRQEVGELLAADEPGHDLLLENRLIVERSRSNLADSDAMVGSVVGSYTLRRLIGRGGMGAVYLAERHNDFEQRVALKLVRPGLNSAESEARFRAERQILARLQHPNIARLLDGGMTDDGRPYLVMEYVEGTPITTFCDDNRYPISERLRLFRVVCHAVQFAHRNLVIHRDLKPSNILVTDDGDVKLLDFGIAKLLDPDWADVSAPSTRTEVRALTPEYASPEQVLGAPVTTSTDVYTLGVLLYELLTGRRPYRIPHNRPAGIERVICEETPSLPSTTIGDAGLIADVDGSTDALTIEEVSRARATQAVRLRRMLKGDLDNVVMMALRKEPERRYGTPEQLADDLGCYLDGHPVAARKDTLVYRGSKFVRRNRVAVGAAAAFVLLLCGFTAITASQATRVSHERDRAEQVSEFLATIFEAANPMATEGDTLTALELLDRGAARIDSELVNQPSVRADLLDVMSRAYLARAANDRAAETARVAVALRTEIASPALPQSLTRLAEALEAQSRFAEADSLYKLVIVHRRNRKDTPALIDALERRGQFLMTSLSPPDTVKAVFQEALSLRRRHYGTDDPGRGRLLFLYAKAHHVGGDYQTAERLFSEALEEQRRYPGDRVITAQTLAQLGPILSFRREYVRADSVLREASALYERIYGRAHPQTATVLGFFGLNLTSLNRLEEAESVIREVLAIHEQHTGRSSKDFVAALANLRRVLTLQERYDEALSVAREVVDLTADLYGADSRSYATNLAHYAQVLHNAGLFAQALPVFREALPLLESAFGADTPYHGTILADAARTLDRLDRASEADPMFERAYSVFREKLAPGNYERRRVALTLGRRRAAAGDHHAADSLFRDAATIRDSADSSPDQLAARASFELGMTLLALGRRAEAMERLEAAEQNLRELLGDGHEETLKVRRILAAATAAGPGAVSAATR